MKFSNSVITANSSLLIALCASSIAAQVEVKLPVGPVVDPIVEITNNSAETVQLNGWRYTMSHDDPNFRLEQIQGPLIKTELPSGEVRIESRPLQMFYQSVGINQTLSAPYKLSWGADPVQLTSPSLLVKKRSDKLILEDEPQIAISDIATITENATYYDPTYRQVDTLGIRGGVYSGGLFDTWFGETQIQMAIPTETFVISNTPLTIDPQNTDGPLYWMGLAMAQEYRNIDFQWLAAIGAKETFAGTSSIYRGDNKERAFGPFEVESSTGSGKALAYYQFFPEYRDTLGSYFALAGAMTALGYDFDGVEFMAHYLHADFTPIGSAMTVNGALFSVLTWYFTYDLLATAEDICWFELLEEAQDPYIGLAVMSPIYNLGINGGGREIGNLLLPHKYKEIASDPNGRDHLPSGNSSYRQSVQIVVDQLVKASYASVENPEVEILDMPITLEQVQAFFFGDNGTAAQLGHGGLCHHFKVDRDALWSDVTEAFNLMKGKAPSTTGLDAISYRYDFLTLLRTVKEPFAQKRMSIHGNEGNNWIRDFSTGDVQPDGQPKDSNFPSAEIIGGSAPFPLTVVAEDDNQISSVEWTFDSTWSNWNTASGEYGASSGSFTIDPTYEQVAHLSSGQAYPLWVRVTDGFQNAEIQKILTDVAVATIESPVAKHSALAISVANSRVNISGISASAENYTVSLFTHSGREVASSVINKNGIVPIDLTGLSRGVYLLKVHSASMQQSSSIIIQ